MLCSRYFNNVTRAEIIPGEINTDGALLRGRMQRTVRTLFSFFTPEFGGKKARVEYSICQGQLPEGELLDLRLSSIFVRGTSSLPFSASPFLSLTLSLSLLFLL